MVSRSGITRTVVYLLLNLVLLHTTGCSPSPGREDWTPGPGLKTRWSANVDASNPLSEYPRPQMERARWHSLNGMWDLAIVPDTAGWPETFSRRILVPFPVESALGGVMGTVTPTDRVWYRRNFRTSQLDEVSGDGAKTAPDGMAEPAPGPDALRWLLHFGAVDWDTEVFLNGRSLGTHRGGYDPFSFDITDALTREGEQELVVAVRDPTNEGRQPRGKQVLDPHGIWYTAVTGIWQTVWLEPVPPVHVSSLRMDPDPETGILTLTVEAGTGRKPPAVQAIVRDRGKEVVRGEGTAGQPLSLAIPTPHLWSPDDPFLYDLKLEVEGGDVVESYFGMRSISVGPDEEGRLRLLLNGEPLFQYGLLDQGWWPDGLYTAPTDEALRFDVARIREMGFNLIRKHVKVEPARWYHHADREGVLVWQDMPSGDFEGDQAQAQFAKELEAVVEALRNHPSIVMWVPFNEGWGQHDTEGYVKWLEEIDSTRLVNNASGWTDVGVGDVMDIHRYPGPGAPDPEFLAFRAPVLGEFGGLGLPLEGHTWVDEENWGYRSYESREALNRAYADLLFQLRPLISQGLSAAVYTQTTDVEVEVNGVMTYDREVVKLSESSLALHPALYDPQPELVEIVPTSRARPQRWKFATEEPPPDWFRGGFDDSGWPEGPGGFGARRPPGAGVGTVWETQDIWLRRSFRLPPGDLARLSPERTYLRVQHDEGAQIYLNGALAADLEGYVNGYRLYPIPPEALSTLVEGTNTLAVHVGQSQGGQFIDVGIATWPVRDPRPEP